MSTSKPVYVVAIGGNALDTEGSKLSHAISAICMLSRKGRVVVTHGNGPQVGELADLEKKSLSILTAQTEGSIGIMLKKNIDNRCIKIHKTAEVVLTPVVVEVKGTRNIKPIGRFYSREEAKGYMAKGMAFRKLVGGYRRVVPSPLPLQIANIDAIRLAMRAHIVIAGGGGGIPIEVRGGKTAFVDAVIDKDYTSSLIASCLRAKSLFILTNVDGAYINFGKRGSKLIKKATVDELEEYIERGEFEDGSMGPKVRACVDFVKKTGAVAVIGNLSHAEHVVKYKSGTIITR